MTKTLQTIDWTDPNSKQYENIIPHVKSVVLDAYIQSKVPWIVTYSGGKDSSIVLDLVLKAAKTHPNGPQIYVVSNNTRIESPLVINHLKDMHSIIRKHIDSTGMNASVHLTEPPLNNSFWVNLIGKGYPAPNQMFRWCTSRLKIDPTTVFTEETLGSKNVLMTVGTRESESVSRKINIAKHEQTNYYSNHTTKENFRIFMPIRYLTDDHVWEYLSTNEPPWGGDYRNLINLYREAYGGECPVITDQSQLNQPSCGERSPRFGCWTCTLVKDDSSLKGLIESGHNELSALYDFRNWLVQTRNNKDNRYPFNRKGQARYNNGKLSFGPYRIEFRNEILNALLNVQKETNMNLITATEIRIIKNIWAEDQMLVKMYKGCKIPLTQSNPTEYIVV